MSETLIALTLNKTYSDLRTKGLVGEAAQLAATKALPKAIAASAASAASAALITSGQIADQAQSSGRDWQDYAAPAVQAGATTAAISLLSGRLLGDVDTAVGARLAGVEGNQFAGGLLKRTAKGFVTEGLAEEAPQSAQEQWQTNRAMGEADLMKGVTGQAVMGAVAGGVTGGVMAGVTGGGKVGDARPTAEQTALPAPVQDSPLSRAAAQGNLTAQTPLALPAPSEKLEFDRTNRPKGGDIVFSDGSTSSTDDYYSHLVSNGLSHEDASSKVYQALLASGKKDEPVVTALPSLPANEIITFKDGSQARASEVLQQLTAAGHSQAQAQTIVDNLAAQANPAAQQKATVQSTGQNALPDYASILSNTQNEKPDSISPSQYALQNFANGLTQDNAQGAVDGLTQEKSPLDLIAEAKQVEQDKVKQAVIAQKQALPLVTRDNGTLFDSRKEAEDHQQQFALGDTHQVMPYYSSYVLAEKNATPVMVNDLLRNRQVTPVVQVAPAAPVTPASNAETPIESAQATNKINAQKPAYTPPPIKADDDLVTAIARLGGLSSEEAKAQGIDPAALNTRARVFGKANVFTKNGRSYDDLAETLAGHGYDIKDANHLVEQVSSAINQGEKIYTPQGHELHAERELSQQYEDRYQQDNHEQSTNEAAQATAQEVTLKTDGKPFATEQQAKQAIKNRRLTNHHAVKMEDGFGITEQQNQTDTANDIPFSLSSRNVSTRTTAFSKNAVEVISRRLFGHLGLHKGNKLRLVVHDTETSLPEPIKKQIERDNAQGSVRGVYHEGAVHIIASNVYSEKEIEEVMLHEALGHYGVRSMFAQDTDRALKRLFLKLGGESGIRVIAAKHDINLDDYFKMAEGKSPQYRAVMLTDELLAHLQGAKVYQTLPQKIKSALVEFWGMIRAILKRNGFKSFQDFSDSDMAYLLKRMAKAARTGEKSGAFVNEERDIRYSIASNAIDYFTGKPRRTTTLSDIDTMLDTGKQPQDKIGWQHYFDMAVTTFTDSSRPFARFIQDTFDAEHASALLSGADRALGMKAAYEKEAMGLFGNKVAKGIKAIVQSTRMDYKTAKDLTGYWLTARYAPDANQWLMDKDQEAIDGLEQEKFDAITKFNALKNPSFETRTLLDAKLIALDKQIVKAKTEQKRRIDAINDPAIIDPTQQKSEAGLAGGFNNATAAEYLAKIEAKIPKALLEAVANPIYAMNQWKLKNDIADGKISQATADKFPNYAHYVPLTGDPRTDDSVEDHFSTGSVNQAKDKALGGRTGSIAQNGIDASFEQVEKSARYHGWNDFKAALTDTYDSLIAEKIATGMKQKDAEQAVWDGYHLKRRAENITPAGENDITVRKDGKGFVYTVNNQGAMEALRSVNDEPTPSILKPIAFFTRLQARMVTQFMPLFAPTNMIRDVAERSENIRTRKIVGHEHLDMNMIARQAIANAGGLLLKIKPIMAGVLAENTPLAKVFPVDNNNADVIMLKRFLALGGSSTYGDMISGDSKSLAEKLRKAGTLSSEAMEVVELWNNAFETISGFAIYKALVENGVSEEKAATASLNLMNFRKRGRVMSPLRALYMFAQPIATGGHQMAMTLSTQRGQVRFAAYTVASMFLYTMLRAGDDDDELGINKMDEQGNFNLYRNILIPMGGGRYFKFPVGFGMQQLAWAHGVNNIRMMLGEMTAAEAVSESTALWVRSAMPIAPAETTMWKNPAVWFAQTFSPQIAKPIVNIGMDRNSFGAPLTNARYERQDKAKSLQGRRDTPQLYKDIAQFFGQHGIDLYPEQVREVVRNYGAGVGNEILKWTVENPAKQARGLSVSSPLIDRYVMTSNDDSLKQRLYYRVRDRMNELNVRESTGDTLTPAERRLADLGNELKHREAQQRGKAAAATKAEKAGQVEKAKNLRAMADRMRLEYMNYALKQAR